MTKNTVAFLLLGLFVTGCSGPYTLEEDYVQDGVAVGSEEIEVDDGKEKKLNEQGYLPNSRYQEALEDGDVNLGPNAPGYIPPPPD